VTMFQEYLERVCSTARQGDAREESYYSALEKLLQEFARSENINDSHVTSQPKKTSAGNPDFRLWKGKYQILGYIEAKTPDQDLNVIEKTEQVARYKSTFPNFILTNFVEFRFYREGVRIETAAISDASSIYDNKRIQIQNQDALNRLLQKFFSFPFPSITSARFLALELAKRTRFLRDEVVAEELREEAKIGTGRILGFYDAFQKYLIRGLTKDQFADLYSQTITFGLFTSRMRCDGEFSRKLAVYDIPHSIGILREMFEFISLGDLPAQLEWIVDDIAIVLANVNVKKIFSEFYENHRGDDPVFHFYETFIAEYDPKERERRGVYYTPKSIVSYIVRSLDEILKEKFIVEDGLADNDVKILDPAAGTLTFVSEAIRQALADFVSKYGEGAIEGFVKEHIMKDFYAFELMIAPYSVGHLKFSFLLDELGYDFRNESIKFYLTNTLELEDIAQTSLPGMASLAEESRKAGEVKKKIPIWVILGNPPYSGISANKGKWISKLIEDYKYCDGKPLDEKNPKWLQDDYVKFIRFAQWKINHLEKGVIGFITNHSYIDNPTFRGMRNHLMNCFDEIYVINLHGNALKRERAPDGNKDENVFDIRQGVAISFFVKNKKYRKTHSICRVFSSDIWGSRDEKYNWLDAHVLKTTDWKEIHPHSPFYLFVPRDESNAEIYDEFWKVTDLFPKNSVGVVSSRDKFVIDFDESVLKNRIETFRNPSVTDQVISDTFMLKDKSGWKLASARKKVFDDKNWDKHFFKITYRPFDNRTIFYHPELIERDRKEVMKHLLRGNIGLVWTRPMSPRFTFSVLVSETLIDQCAVGNKTAGAGISYVAPLFLHNHKSKANIEPSLLKLLKKSYGNQIEQYPESILYYAYAVLYSNIFRNKYNEFLKVDFPRVPFTNDAILFKSLSELGEKLVNLHLLKSDSLNCPLVKFEGKGNTTIEKVEFDVTRQLVNINENQYFTGIKQDLWNYQIGGYQVLRKWLEDRKNREMTIEDIKQYAKIVMALQETIEIQSQIDGLYPQIEKSLISLKKNSEVRLDKYKT